MRTKLFLIIIASFSLLTACKIQAPQVKGIENAKMDKASLKEINFNADLKIYNPNWFAAKVLDLDVEVFANDASIGRIGDRQAFRVKTKKDFNVPLSFMVKPADLTMTMVAAMASNGKADLKFVVNGKARFLFFKRKFSYTHKEKVQF